MVKFDSSFRRDNAEDGEGPTLDRAVGQRAAREVLDPLDLLALMAFKSPESKDVTLSHKGRLITLAGPSKMSEEEDPIFVASFETADRVVGEVCIRERTGAFGKTGEISHADVSGLVQTIKCRLLESALERTSHFVAHYIEAAKHSAHREDTLAGVGADVELLKLVMYGTEALHKKQLREQSAALMKVLVSDELTASLIVALGAVGSIITDITPKRPPEALLGSITDAYVVSQYGLSYQSPVALHQLLGDKTTLALIKPTLEEHCRGKESSPWASALSQE
jgi:hypothetical protein